MIKLYRSNSALNFIVLPIITFGLWFLAIYFQGSGFDNSTPNIEDIIGDVIETDSALVSRVLSVLDVIGLLISAFVIYSINVRITILECRTFLPSYVYVICVLSFPISGHSSLEGITALFITLGIMSALELYREETEHYSAEFRTAFLFSIASILYFPFILLFIFLILAIFFSRRGLTFKGVVISIFGIIIPWFYLYATLYIYGGVPKIEEFTEFMVGINNFNNLELNQSVLIPLITISTMAFVARWLSYSGDQGVSIEERRIVNVMTTLLVLSILFLLFTPRGQLVAPFILSIPCSFFISKLIMNIRWMWVQIMFWLNFVLLLILSLF